MSGSEALQERYEALRARLVPYVARRVPNEDVDDVVQEVFVRLSRHREQLLHATNYDAWMWAIARNAVQDRHRQRARHPRSAGEVGADEESAEPAIDSRLDEHHQDDLQERLASLIAPFIAMLPSPYREALTLVELEGLTQQAAAELRGIPLSTMKTHVQRGRAKLRTLFEACCEIGVDARGRVVSCEPRQAPCECRSAEGVRSA